MAGVDHEWDTTLLERANKAGAGAVLQRVVEDRHSWCVCGKPSQRSSIRGKGLAATKTGLFHVRFQREADEGLIFSVSHKPASRQ